MAAKTPSPIAKISLVSVMTVALATGFDVAGKLTLMIAILFRTGTPLSETATVRTYLSSNRSSSRPIMVTSPFESTANKL